MSGRLAGKVCVITGGASGMGRATALRFLDEGASVVVADLNDATGKEFVEAASALGHARHVRFARTDVAEEADVAAMIELALRDFGRLDVVFNNAGLGGAFGPITDLEVEDWDFTFAVLVRGVFLGIKHAARALKRQGQGGSIINTASVAALTGGSGPLCYSACKAAVVNLTRAAAVELAPDRIRVNAICPGGIVTPLTHRGNPEATRARLATLQPWPEAGEGEHIAGAALFLASDDSRFVSGEPLVVDGALTAAGPNLISRLRENASDANASVFATLRGVDNGSTGRPPVIRTKTS
ncbi:MAG TPA: SDR family oxidoreductase [Myxococcota bacterium]|nr:SDR family oxidoreductase [Myxococcota bacterium]